MPLQLQQAALNALDAGDLSKLDQMLASLATKSETKQARHDGIDLKPAGVAELNDDLVYTFTEQDAWSSA